MRKKWMMIGLMLAIFTVGCGNKSESTESTESVQVVIEESEKETELESEVLEESFDFAELSKVEFNFSSGAGGWRTYLKIEPDGSFRGQYSDSEMGSVGEDYPNGTYYVSDFTGRFSVSKKIDENTYVLKIEELNYGKTPGTEEIVDEMLYIYSEAHGISGTKEMILYLPGTAIENLPEGYLNWVNFAMEENAEWLAFYGLYNETEETGFSSYMIADPIDILMENTKTMDQSIRSYLSEENLTQAEMNEKSEELYALWDSALNTLWSELKANLSEKDFQKLLDEQRTWIDEKEAAVKKAGDEVDGGTAYPLVVNMTAATITEERVYELYDLWGNM